MPQDHANDFLQNVVLHGKGLGGGRAQIALDEVGRQDWHLLRGDVSLPAAVLRESALRHNLAWMRDFTRAYGLRLAPHGKTTMSPELFRMQLEAGAWGITLATAPQVRDAWRHGVRRVLMANQLVDRGSMAIIAGLLRDPAFEFCCLVDSAANADALGAFFSAQGQTLRVLLEVGVDGGRTGVRDEAQARTVAAAVARWPGALALAGVGTYEGVLADEAGIRTLLRRCVATLRQLRDDGAFAAATPILTGAGSAWFDVVAEEFAALADEAEVVLRPGCYLTHDAGPYREAAARIHAHNPVARDLGRALQPALKLWACVQSRPEPALAVVALGKRDAAFDAGFPQPVLHCRAGATQPTAAPAHWTVTKMMDQHAFLRVGEGDDAPGVGDLLCFDISHPCLTFDKWRHLLLVDDDWRVTGAVRTCF